MPSAYDLFEETREAVDRFMREESDRDIELPRCLGCGSRGCMNPNCGPLDREP